MFDAVGRQNEFAIAGKLAAKVEVQFAVGIKAWIWGP